MSKKALPRNQSERVRSSGVKDEKDETRPDILAKTGQGQHHRSILLPASMTTNSL